MIVGFNGNERKRLAKTRDKVLHVKDGSRGEGHTVRKRGEETSDAYIETSQYRQARDGQVALKFEGFLRHS